MSRGWHVGAPLAEIDDQVRASGKSRQIIYHARYNRKYPEKYLWKTARTRARKYGLEFDLDPSDCVMPERCPILGVRLEVYSFVRGNPTSASIDRIDNTRGYVKDNVQVISLLANQMKSTANAEQLRAFAAWVQKTYGD